MTVVAGSSDDAVGGGRVKADTGPSVGDVGERALITALTETARRARLALGEANRGLLVGPGDDAAVLAIGPDVVVSTDTLVQDRHFRLDWSSPTDIGRRAAIASVADIAAMGARCSAVVVSIACPPGTLVALVLAMNQGLNDAATAIGAHVVGGDVVSAAEIVLTVTALGSTDGRSAVTVAGARVGDTIAVSGPLGSSAAGLALLAAGVDGFDELVAAHRVPTVDLAQGVLAARAGAHAMTDVSDGLGDELATIARASDVALDVASVAIPVADRLAAAAAVLDVDPVGWMVGGGEDHQLLATFGGPVPDGWTPIGTVVDGDDVPPVRVDGVVPNVRGWQSF